MLSFDLLSNGTIYLLSKLLVLGLVLLLWWTVRSYPVV